MKLDTFTKSYIETLLWSECDDNGEPLDGIYDTDDIHKESLKSIVEDCQGFMTNNWANIRRNLSQAGHDFALTRNRHGAGFWDGDWEQSVGQVLTNASHSFGGQHLYVGDDNKLHVM